MKQKKFLLPEGGIPDKWYNILADMPHKPLPMLDPVTRQPVTVESLSGLFSRECSEQELNMTDRWIDIPQPVLERYASTRCFSACRQHLIYNSLRSYLPVMVPR